MLEIIKLVREGNLEGLKTFKVDQGDKFDANERDKGMCALHFAANKALIEIADWLIAEGGADINAALNADEVNGFGGFTPLFLAIQKHDPSNPDQEKRVNMMPLIIALLNNPNLKIGAILTEELYEGYTILHFALRKQKKDVAEAILQSPNAEKIISVRSAHGTTPFAKAIDAGFRDIANKLSAMGADTTVSLPSASTLATPSATPMLERSRSRITEDLPSRSDAALVAAEHKKRSASAAAPATAISAKSDETTGLIDKADKGQTESASCCSCSIQ